MVRTSSLDNTTARHSQRGRSPVVRQRSPPITWKNPSGLPSSYPDGMEDSDVERCIRSHRVYLDTCRPWKTLVTTASSHRMTAWKDALECGPSFSIIQRFREQEGLIDIGCRPRRILKPHIMTNTIGWGHGRSRCFSRARFIEDLNRLSRKGRCQLYHHLPAKRSHIGTAKARPPGRRLLITTSLLDRSSRRQP